VRHDDVAIISVVIFVGLTAAAMDDDDIIEERRRISTKSDNRRLNDSNPPDESPNVPITFHIPLTLLPNFTPSPTPTPTPPSIDDDDNNDDSESWEVFSRRDCDKRRFVASASSWGGLPPHPPIVVPLRLRPILHFAHHRLHLHPHVVADAVR
jgi:hypothetical protein